MIGFRGRFIESMGAGKTQTQFKAMKEGFKDGFKLQVIVAPTIALNTQHYQFYEEYGMFDKGIKPVEFRTGKESRTHAQNDYFKTTSEKELRDYLLSSINSQFLIFTTYASFKKLYKCLISIQNEIGRINHICFDEFQNLITQKKNQKEFIKKLEADIITFWSASIKRGRIISATDEELFGKMYSNITFKDLREKGIVVPIKVIPIYVNHKTEKLKRIKHELREIARNKKIDFDKLLTEIAGTIISYQWVKENVGHCNLITFSKQVKICKEIINDDNKVIRSYFDGDLNMVYAGTDGNERNKIFGIIKKSTDSVLVQHSVVSEGINITGFNAALVARGMEIIPIQQGPVGRPCRAHPEDSKNLKDGKISIDSSNGWIKPYAYVFILVDSTDAEDMKNLYKELIKKLQESGLSDNDYQFVDISKERIGYDTDENWIAPIKSTEEVLDKQTLDDIIKKAKIAIEKEEENDEIIRGADALNDVPLIDLL